MIHLLTLFRINRLMLMGILISFCACQRASEEISGTYRTSLPLASGPFRSITLTLGDDQTAMLHTIYQNREKASTQRGSWALTERDSITVFLIEKNARMVLDTLGLSIQDNQLIIRDADYGNDAITLVRELPE